MVGMRIGCVVIVFMVVIMRVMVIVTMLMTMALFVRMGHVMMMRGGTGCRSAGTYSLDMMMVTALRRADLVLEAQYL